MITALGVATDAIASARISGSWWNNINPLPEGLNLFVPAPSDLFWSAIMLIAIAIVMYKLVMPMVNRVLDERTALIDGGLAQAEEVKIAADHALEQRQLVLDQAQLDAARMREEARQESEAIVTAARTEASSEARRITDSATQQIAAAQQAAEVQLRHEVGELAGRLATKIVSESLITPQAKSRAIDEFLDDLDRQLPDATEPQRPATPGGKSSHHERTEDELRRQDQLQADHVSDEDDIHAETKGENRHLEAGRAEELTGKQNWGTGKPRRRADGTSVHHRDIKPDPKLVAEGAMASGWVSEEEAEDALADEAAPAADLLEDADGYEGRLSAARTVFEEPDLGVQP